jgi:hypothetical protein
MTTTVTTAPGCTAATDGEHELHWFVIPALWVNGKRRRPARKRALCWNHGCNHEENR